MPPAAADRTSTAATTSARSSETSAFESRGSFACAMLRPFARLRCLSAVGRSVCAGLGLRKELGMNQERTAEHYLTVANVAKHDACLDFRASCDSIPVLMLVDPTEQLHKVGLRVRVKLQEARWPLQIVQLLTGLTIVQDVR